MKDDPYVAVQHSMGDRGWEIVAVNSRNRVCADMTEHTARSLCALINAAAPLASEYNIPAQQIAAIWRLVKDNGGINET